MSGKIYIMVGALMSAAGVAMATPITIANPSFESPAVADGSSTTTVDNWTTTLFVQEVNPTGNGVGTTGQAWTTPVPDGNQVLEMTAAGDAYDVSADQMVHNTFAVGQTYTFSVWVGNSFESDLPQGYAVRVFGVDPAGTSHYLWLATTNTNPVANGTWSKISATYTVKTGDPLIGNGYLDFNLTNGSGYDNSQDSVYFDDFTASVAVPEPASIALVGLALAGLMLPRKHRAA